MVALNSLPRQRERKRKRKKAVIGLITALGVTTYLGFQTSRLFSPDVPPEDYVDSVDKHVVTQVSDEGANDVLEDIAYMKGAEDTFPETISAYDDFEKYFYRDGLWDADLLEKYFSLENLDDFKYPDDMGIILYTAYRLDVDPALLLAIRQAEGGGAGKEFGILPEAMSKEMRQRYYNDKGIYEPNGSWREYIVRFPGDELEKQVTWSAWTIRKNKERYRQAGGNPDKIEEFIDFLGDRYAPSGAENDPHNLNQYWERNVLKLLRQYSAVY